MIATAWENATSFIAVVLPLIPWRTTLEMRKGGPKYIPTTKRRGN
jgi:hypothetical protein